MCGFYYFNSRIKLIRLVLKAVSYIYWNLSQHRLIQYLDITHFEDSVLSQGCVCVVLFAYVFILYLADDMGLGKTLTMIALILSQKKKEEKDSQLEGWLSKNGKNSCSVAVKLHEWIHSYFVCVGVRVSWRLAVILTLGQYNFLQYAVLCLCTESSISFG